MQAQSLNDLTVWTGHCVTSWVNKALLLVESKLFRWRLWHGFVAALLVAAVLAVGLPSTQTWRPVQLWAAPTKDVPALRIHGGSLTGILRSRLDNWSRIESDSWDKVLRCFRFQRFEGFWKRDVKRTSERWVSVEAKFQGGKQTRPRSGSAIPHVALGATSVHRQIRGAKMLQHHPVEGHSCWAECYKTMNEWCEVLPTTAFILEWLDVCVCVGTVCGMKGPRLVWLSHRVMQQNCSSSKRQLYDVEVTLEIEGRIIHNVKMHTRGHSSAMCLGCKQSPESTPPTSKLLKRPGFRSTNLGCACPKPFLYWAWRLRGVCELKRMLLAGLKKLYAVCIQ